MSPQLDITPPFTDVVFTTLLLYDYTLTFAREIELFWKRPIKSWTFALFVANRYISVLGHVPTEVYSFWSPATSSDYSRCKPTHLANQWIIVVVQVIGSIIMTMRVYVLYPHNRPVLILLLALWLGIIVVGCWAVFSSNDTSSGSTDFVPPTQLTGNVGCPNGSYLSSEQGMYIAIAWSGQLLYDFVVFLLTLVGSLRIRKEGTRSRSIIDILLRDGSLYFAVMCAANVANVTVLLVETNALKSSATTLINAISAILISRLMLNLRDPKVTNPMGSSLLPLSHSNMVFASPRAGAVTSTGMML
ncbi:hypothetical protein SCLCIDRAFT_1212996 [Scleroderma citrinum Foug A]|uniref:DUF6533 domain-containing protein n=1 Tax=Scleroderma citrinum Foug A TaxID=1036808 RepID=A0A0C3EA70_9AGAM|nr:hypothetical protein SCLCIDRAFT_1212996 [Scleroderma citrinum Foug A]